MSYVNTYALMQWFPMSPPQTLVYPSKEEMLQTCHIRSPLTGRHVSLDFQNRIEAMQELIVLEIVLCLLPNFESCG